MVCCIHALEKIIIVLSVYQYFFFFFVVVALFTCCALFSHNNNNIFVDVCIFLYNILYMPALLIHT